MYENIATSRVALKCLEYNLPGLTLFAREGQKDSLFSFIFLKYNHH